MITKVTFKDEGEVEGISVGPVTLIDEVLFNRDPKVKGKLWPYGYTPQGMTKLDGWLTKPQALALAREHGVQLSEL